MRRLTITFLVVALVLACGSFTRAKAKLLVTKEVLAEYVEDRLSQLEGKKKLGEEEAVELDFIRENRRNLQELAEFYNMKIREEEPGGISLQKAPSVNEIQEQSVKETPQSHPITLDMVELDSERAPTEITLPESSQPEGKPNGFIHEENLIEGTREKKMEEKIATKYVIQDEGTTSPLETSSAFKESQTTITPQKSIPQLKQPSHGNDLTTITTLKEYDAPSDLKRKSISSNHLPVEPSTSIEREVRIVQPKQTEIIATKEEVRQFFADYVGQYTQKNTEGFLSLFSPKVVQNRRDGYEKIKEIYSDFFKKSHELHYHIDDMRMAIYQNAVVVRGRYEVNQILKRGKRKVWKGYARWVLAKESGALRIRYLEYRHEKSPQ